MPDAPRNHPPEKTAAAFPDPETADDLRRPPERHPKDHFLSVAFLAKALSDPNRLRILLSVGREKKSVSTIVEEMALSQPLVSHHLKELKRSLLVRVERDGPFIYYQLSDARILHVVDVLAAVAGDLLADRKTF